MKTAIVLSGGGSKGSYEIGAWKALRRLHIKYDIVTGTSIGSLNGAFMVQNDYYKAYNLWTKLDYNLVLDDEIKDPSDLALILKTYTKGIMDGGMSVKALEKTIADNLNTKKFFKSKVDYALITVKFPSLKPIVKYKKDLAKEPEKLKDYLMASSACFPAFKKKNIDNNKYIDGGYYDNLPINPAIDLGADRIIAINLNEVGFAKKPKKKVDITYIEPRNYFGSFLVFDSELAKRGMRLGYNDTMKTFGKLDGNIYTFKKRHLKINYKIYGEYYYKLLDSVIDKNDSILSKLFNKRILSSDKEKNFNEVVESVGKIFKIDDSYIYKIYNFNKLVKERFQEVPVNSYSRVEEQIKLNKIKLLFNAPELVYYLYSILDKKDKKSIHRLFLIFPTEVLCALYIKTIMKK